MHTLRFDISQRFITCIGCCRQKLHNGLVRFQTGHFNHTTVTILAFCVTTTVGPVGPNRKLNRYAYVFLTDYKVRTCTPPPPPSPPPHSNQDCVCMCFVVRSKIRCCTTTAWIEFSPWQMRSMYSNSEEPLALSPSQTRRAGQTVALIRCTQCAFFVCLTQFVFRTTHQHSLLCCC